MMNNENSIEKAMIAIENITSNIIYVAEQMKMSQESVLQMVIDSIGIVNRNQENNSDCQLISEYVSLVARSTNGDIIVSPSVIIPVDALKISLNAIFEAIMKETGKNEEEIYNDFLCERIK